MTLPDAESQRAAYSPPRPYPDLTPRRDPRTAPFVLVLLAASKREPGAGIAPRHAAPGSAVLAFAARLIARRRSRLS